MAEGAVWSSAIVEVDLTRQCGVSFAAVAAERAVGAAARQGADEALGLAVGLGADPRHAPACTVER